MTKKVFLVHGWGGYPREGWRPWLTKELEERGFEVINPEMPDTNNPLMKKWVYRLQQLVDTPNNNCYFIGHSLGAITILRYLEQLRESEIIGGAIFVAGFGYDLEYKGYKGELSNFFKTPLNWEKIRSPCKKFIIIHSNNDQWVSLKHNKFLARKLNGKAIIEHNMKHFSGDDGVTKLPIVLKELLLMSKNE